MPFRPGQSGNAKGRKKGTPNKATAEVKDIIQNVFDKIGGEEEFAVWAKAHKDLFYANIYTKILPRNIEVGNKDNKPFELTIGIRNDNGYTIKV